MSRVVASLLTGFVLNLILHCPQAWADSDSAADSAYASARVVLEHARAEAEQDCAQPSDILVKILCDKTLKVGLRTYYPGFSVRDANGTYSGFEVDVASRIAAFLGVALVPVAVDPKNRIPMVANGDVDLVIATMGHDVRRDSQVTFIRPHYYESRTVVVGARDTKVSGWADLVGHTVCLPVGSSSNILFIQHDIRILTFDRPEQLLDALTFGECAFIVHDDIFFGPSLADPGWASRFTVMFGFAPLPWGMAVAHEQATELAELLEDLSTAFHADGVFLELARAQHLDLAFLEAEHVRWTSIECVMRTNLPLAGCLLPPADNTDANDSSGFAPQLAWLEQVLAGWFGIRLDMSLLLRRSAVDLLLRGVGYSLAAVAGALASTAFFALVLARLMVTGPALTRRAVGVLTLLGQTSPLPLLMFFGYVVAGGVVQYSGPVALVVAIAVIGVYNGCNAARAIADAYRAQQSPRAAMQHRPVPLEQRSFMGAVSVATIQLVAFLINAAKGSPAAGMIGVPEFLNVMTDLTAYSRDRVGVYLILLVFYTGLVLGVILLLSSMEKRLIAASARQR